MSTPIYDELREELGFNLEALSQSWAWGGSETYADFTLRALRRDAPALDAPAPSAREVAGKPRKKS